MSTNVEEQLDAFTIRIPRTLKEQIEKRAGVNKRSRNMEITALLENAIDSSVKSDLDLMQKHRQSG